MVVTQPFDDSSPGRVELPGRCGRTAPGHAIRLFDEDDAPIERLGGAMRRGEIRRADAAAGTVAEDEQPDLTATPVEMRAGEAVGCLDLEDATHHATAVCPIAARRYRAAKRGRLHGTVRGQWPCTLRADPGAPPGCGVGSSGESAPPCR